LRRCTTRWQRTGIIIMEVLRLAVLDQQEARAKAYADFEAGYVSYLGGGSDEEYEALCKSVTGRFAASSEEIKKSEAEIMKGGGEKLCGFDPSDVLVPSLHPHCSPPIS